MVIGITKQWVWISLPVLGGLFGHYLDTQETQRMTRFRDKSALYYRALKPGEAPSW